MYFSKNIIPHVRSSQESTPPIYRHIGMYGYSFEALVHYANLPPTPFEKIEQLEQLRALEHGVKIRVIQTDYQGRTHWSIDTPEDLQVAEQLIATEGELLPLYDGSYRWEQS